MDQIEYPDATTWGSRKEWFEKTLERSQHPLASYFVSDQATSLLVDLESCYCAGAFLAVVLLSVSIIDSQLRETGVGDKKIGTAKLLSEYYTGQNIDWIRRLRNRYVHIDVDSPALGIDDQYFSRSQMQEDARKAITMVFHAFFQDPGT